MQYRDVVDFHKQQYVDQASRQRVALADVSCWEAMRQQLASFMHGALRTETNAIIDDSEISDALRDAALSVRSDVFGVTRGGTRMPGAIDASDAGPERGLANLLRQADIADAVIAVRLCVSHALYKSAKWESASQLKHLLDAFDDSEADPDGHGEALLQLQLACAQCQSAIETDIETKPQLKHRREFVMLIRELRRLEVMDLPFPAGEERDDDDVADDQ